MPYDTVNDLLAVAQTQWTSKVLVTRPTLGANNMAQLVALARRPPPSLSYSSGRKRQTSPKGCRFKAIGKNYANGVYSKHADRR
ncbi:hypothetical protein J7E62_32160 [Variovorax paradoxus]|nr:hypothetical protein [Variovorax paradoxus]